MTFAAALSAACGPPTTEHVASIDLLEALAPERPIRQRELRSEGTLRLCEVGRRIEARVDAGGEGVGGGCVGLDLERVDREGAFPFVDGTVGQVAYPANEAHLMVRARQWFVLLVGGHDQSVINRHSAAVFRIPSGEGTATSLELTCHAEIEAYDTDPRYDCIGGLSALDGEVVAWTGRDSCSIDYSVCGPGGPP